MKKQSLAIAISGLAVAALFIWLLSYLDVFGPGRGKAPGTDSGEAKSHKAEPIPIDDAALSLVFSPKNGEVLSYHFTMASDSELSSAIFSSGEAQGPPSSAQDFVHLKMDTSGDLFLKYFIPERPDEDMNVSGIIENLKLTMNGQTPNYAQGMTYPFAVQMDAKGYLNDFTFTRGTPEEAQLMIKSLLYAMQTVYPKERNRTWKTREIDSTGQYQAEYQIPESGKTDRDFTIEKSKKAYLLLVDENTRMAQGLAPTEVRIEKSRIRTRVPEHGAWIVATDQDETTEIMAGTLKLGRGNAQFSAIRQEKTPATAFAGTFTEALSSLSSPAFLKDKYTATDPELNALSANFSLDAALSAYLSMRGSENTTDRLQAGKFFVNYLRQNPKACYDLINLLDADAKKERFSHEEQLELWQLITKAGHEDAQRAVLEAIGNGNYSDLTHIRALAYIHDFEYPESFVTEGLWHFYNAVDMEKGNDQAKELGSMALYAIGDLGSQEKLNESIKPVIGKSLADNLAKATDTEIQTLTLQAIGNYGGSDVLDQVKPYFTSESERVRVAAFEAIRQMNTSEVFDTFVDSYSSESSQNVRTSALKILESMSPTEDTIAWAGKEVLKVSESEDQESLAKVLGKNIKDYPQGEEPLRQLLSKNPSNIVKKTVYRYIAPK